VRRTLLLAGIAVVLAGCSTVVRPFTHIAPDYSELSVDDMRAIAYEVEQAVQQGNRTPEIADRAGIVINDPAILQAIRTRAARLELLNEFRNSGFAVEQRNGLIEIRTGGDYSEAFTRRQRDRNALLILRENQDRWTLYEGILESSNLGRKSLSAIQRIFYEERVKTLPDGQKYEDESGADVAKGATR